MLLHQECTTKAPSEARASQVTDALPTVSRKRSRCPCHKAQLGQRVRLDRVKTNVPGYTVGVYKHRVPRISSHLLDCAIYLYQTEAGALEGKEQGGSGFLHPLPTRSDSRRPRVPAVRLAGAAKPQEPGGGRAFPRNKKWWRWIDLNHRRA